MKCLQCQASSSSDNDFKTKKWSVVKLTDLKHRGFFVGSGDVHVRGWQLESVDEDFSTHICKNCMETHIKKSNESHISKCALFKKWQKILNITCLPIGITTLALVLGLSFIKPDAPMNLYLAGLIAAGILLPIVFSWLDPSAHKPSDETLADNMHRSYIEQYRAAISERLDTQVRHLILHPEPLMPAPPNMALGMHFIVPNTALSSYKTSKEKTGWSRIDYYHKNGNGIEGNYAPHLQSQNLRNFELEHWGEFLSNAQSSFKSVTGFFERPPLTKPPAN